MHTIRAQNYAIICLLATFVPIFYSRFYPLSLFLQPINQYYAKKRHKKGSTKTHVLVEPFVLGRSRPSVFSLWLFAFSLAAGCEFMPCSLSSQSALSASQRPGAQRLRTCLPPSLHRVACPGKGGLCLPPCSLLFVALQS